jgi:hypothetical protein
MMPNLHGNTLNKGPWLYEVHGGRRKRKRTKTRNAKRANLRRTRKNKTR